MKRYLMTVEVLVEVDDDTAPDFLVVEELVYGSIQDGVTPDDVRVVEYETVGFEPAAADEGA